jgi:hypothetical protein
VITGRVDLHSPQNLEPLPIDGILTLEDLRVSFNETSFNSAVSTIEIKGKPTNYLLIIMYPTF